MSWRVVFGIVIIILVIGVAGFMYRSSVEQKATPTACTTDAKVCPDGTALSRTGPGCTFPACPPPNVELPAAGLAFALPAGYEPIDVTDNSVIAAYGQVATSTSTSTPSIESDIVIRQFALDASTAEDFIRSNAILSPSGLPAPATAFSSVTLGSSPGNTFTVVQTERFEGVVDTTYYLTHGDSVLRFDAITRGADWTNPSLNVATLKANQDLRTLLGTLEGS